MLTLVRSDGTEPFVAWGVCVCVIEVQKEKKSRCCSLQSAFGLLHFTQWLKKQELKQFIDRNRCTWIIYTKLERRVIFYVFGREVWEVFSAV